MLIDRVQIDNTDRVRVHASSGAAVERVGVSPRACSGRPHIRTRIRAHACTVTRVGNRSIRILYYTSSQIEADRQVFFKTL